MQIKKHIPNLITLLNLFCGCIAIVFLAQTKFEMAFYFMCLGIFLDFFDGYFARLFNVSSPLGLQLDSLADMVTSGLVPGFAMFWLIRLGNIATPLKEVLPYFGFVIALASCYRLAKFNLDTRQTNFFIGLPTPANALFILSLLVIVFDPESASVVSLELLTNQYFLIGLTIFSAYMMNSEIHLFSLKMKGFNIKTNKIQIIFASISVLLLIIYGYAGIPLVIVSYVLLSIINNRFLNRGTFNAENQ